MIQHYTYGPKGCPDAPKLAEEDYIVANADNFGGEIKIVNYHDGNKFCVVGVPPVSNARVFVMLEGTLKECFEFFAKQICEDYTDNGFDNIV